MEGLLKQILTGSVESLCPQLWYQAVLIVLTIMVFAVLYLIPEKRALFCMYGLLLLSVYLQYSGVNYGIFNGASYEIIFSAGRVIEMIPFAVIGFMIAYYKVPYVLLENRCKTLLEVILFFLLICSVELFSNQPGGFGYQGISYLVIAATIFIFVLVFPFEKLSSWIKNMLIYVSKYSLGIYCIHWGVGKYINLWLEKQGKETNSFSECIVIFVISLLTSIIIGSVFGENGKKLVQ